MSLKTYENRLYKYFRGGYIYGFTARDVVLDTAIHLFEADKIQAFVNNEITLVDAKGYYLKSLSNRSEHKTIDLIRKERAAKRGSFDWHTAYQNEYQNDLDTIRQIKATLSEDDLVTWVDIENETSNEVLKDRGLSTYQIRNRRLDLIERARSKVLEEQHWQR